MKAGQLVMTAAMAVTLAFGAPLYAEQDYHGDKRRGYHHGDKQGQYHHGMDSGEHYGGKMLETMAEKLELTEDQKNRIDTIQEKSRETAQPLREELKRNMQAEHAAFASGVGEKDLKRLAMETAESRIDLMLHRRGVQQEIQAVLTTEQKAKLEAWKVEHKARWQEGRQKWRERGTGEGE